MLEDYRLDLAAKVDFMALTEAHAMIQLVQVTFGKTAWL